MKFSWVHITFYSFISFKKKQYLLSAFRYVPATAASQILPWRLERALTWVDQSTKGIRIPQKTKSRLFFDNETGLRGMSCDCFVRERNLKGVFPAVDEISIFGGNFHEICITGGSARRTSNRKGRKVSEPKEALNLLSLTHFCTRTANKKRSSREEIRWNFPPLLEMLETSSSSLKFWDKKRNLRKLEVSIWRNSKRKTSWGFK